MPGALVAPCFRYEARADRSPSRDSHPDWFRGPSGPGFGDFPTSDVVIQLRRTTLQLRVFRVLTTGFERAWSNTDS